MVDSDLVKEKFYLSDEKISQLGQLEELIISQNQKINLISRKDTENVFLHHILHSMALAFHCKFPSNSRVLDVGTGGGFPGLPLAIMFPEVKFHLIDSKRKKIESVKYCINELGLKNCEAEWIRAEDLKGKFDFVVSRAVTQLPKFCSWLVDKMQPGKVEGLARGIYYLRGEDFDFVEINKSLPPEFDCARVVQLKEFLNDDFFSSKLIACIHRI